MPEYVCHKKDGAIVNKRQTRKFFDDLPDGKYLVKADPFKKRSLKQNAFLHGIIIPIVFKGLRDAGFEEVRTTEDAKSVIKSLFLKRAIPNVNTGEAIEFIQDTHKLSTVEFMEFIEAVIKWAAEYLNVYCPFPGEQMNIDYE